MSNTPPTTPKVLDVAGLTVELTTKSERRTVLRDVSFSVTSGQLLGVVGQTGSGKSITLRAVLGLLPIGSRVLGGSIALEGKSILGLRGRELREIRGTKIGFVPQQPIAALNPIRPMERQFYSVMKAHEKLSYRAARQRAIVMLSRVGISDPERVLGSYAHELSGGIAQRIVIALALSLRPNLILADEPTTALDVTIQREILDLLRGLVVEEQLAMVLVTHDLSVVANYCDGVVVLHQGEVVERGLTGDVLARPTAAYTRRLLAAVGND